MKCEYGHPGFGNFVGFLATQKKKNFYFLNCVVFIMKSSLFWRSNMSPQESAFLKSALILLVSPEKYLPPATMACHTGTLGTIFFFKKTTWQAFYFSPYESQENYCKKKFATNYSSKFSYPKQAMPINNALFDKI